MLLMLTTGRRFHRRGPPRRGRRNTISRAFQTECLRNHSAQSVKLALVVFEAKQLRQRQREKLRVSCRFARTEPMGSRPVGREPSAGGGGGTAHSVAFAAGWTMPSSPCPLRARGCGACYPDDCIIRILVPAPACRLGESMSLYRAGLKLAFSLPLGVAMPLSRESAVRFHRCELRFSVDLHRPTRPIDRTPVRKR